MHKLYKVILTVTLVVLANLSFGQDFGVYGALYPIAEPDMLHSIYIRLNEMKQSGELAEKNKEFSHRAVKHILRPPAVKGVTDLGNGKPTQHYFNPTIKINKDITDPSGRIIAKKGDMVNPLKIIHFNEVLYFIDADNPYQIKWMNKEIKISDQINQNIKIIMVKGNTQKTSKRLNHEIFFDQYGYLCKRFKIKHTPTVVYQPVQNGIIVPRLLVKEVKDV